MGYDLCVIAALFRNESLRRQVEEKFPKENFRAFREMRILAKIKLEILDFVRYVENLNFSKLFNTKFGSKIDFRV